MKKIHLILTACFCCGFTCAQETVPGKPNPIIYAELLIGPSFGEANGLLLGMEANYQIHRNLFSLRYSNSINAQWALFFFIPIAIISESTEEFALLYGWRYIQNGFSFSVSAGVSHNWHIDYDEGTGIRYAGFPFEVNIKWFKSRKKIIYQAGQALRSPAFSAGAGFKLTGNLSKESYVGVGLVFSLGTHKVYTPE